MNELKTKLYKCFETLENGFFDDFITSIDKRIVFQKYGLFFSTIFGLTTGTFSLYLHGPYNSSLADLGYEFARNKEDFATDNTIIFSDKAVDIINSIREQLPLEKTDLLEIYSTYFYLKNKHNDMSEEQVLARVHEVKNDLFVKNPCITDELLFQINENLKRCVNTSGKIVIN